MAGTAHHSGIIKSVRQHRIVCRQKMVSCQNECRIGRIDRRIEALWVPLSLSLALAGGWQARRLDRCSAGGDEAAPTCGARSQILSRSETDDEIHRIVGESQPLPRF
jgi:hypothetical protein